MLCERLAEYVTSIRFEDIPREVVEKTKAVASHEIAVALGGVGVHQTNCALDLIERKEGLATVLGQVFKAAPIDAAFANTVAGRALRSEGTLMPSIVHLGACLVPTALAFAEEYGRSGAEVLIALVVGCEVVGRVAGSAQDWDKPYRCSSHIFAALGVAAAAAKLMDLDVEQTAGALAQACNLGAMISTGMQDVQYGILTRNGIFAAQLGKCRAPFAEDALEGPVGLYEVQLHGCRPTDEEIVGSFGKRFAIMSTILKPHPCTGGNLAPIEIVRQEMSRRGLTGDNIRRITVTRSRQAQQLDNIDNYGPFDGAEGGIYEVTTSLPFALGVMLVDGEITREHFLTPNEPRILAAAKQKVRIDYTLDVPFCAFRDRVEIETEDGETITREEDPSFLPVPDVSKLLNTYGVPVVGEAKIRDLKEALARFETLPDIGALTRCLA